MCVFELHTVYDARPFPCTLECPTTGITFKLRQPPTYPCTVSKSENTHMSEVRRTRVREEKTKKSFSHFFIFF